MGGKVALVCCIRLSIFEINEYVLFIYLFGDGGNCKVSRLFKVCMREWNDGLKTSKSELRKFGMNNICKVRQATLLYYGVFF